MINATPLDAVNDDGSWGKKSGRRCQVDEECTLCSAATGLVCEQSAPGVDGGCSGAGAESSYGKAIQSLLAPGETFEYTAEVKSFEYVTAEAERLYLESIRL